MKSIGTTWCSIHQCEEVVRECGQGHRVKLHCNEDIHECQICRRLAIREWHESEAQVGLL